MQQDKSSSPILSGPIGPTLLRMAIPLALGMIAILLFTVVDLYFVSQLSADHAAAMGFVFPISFVVMSSLMGIGVGISSVLAHVLGQGEHERAKKMATHAIILTLLLAVMLMAVALLTMTPVFQLMGAAGTLLTRVEDYFLIWTLGVPALAFLMAGNSILRASGNTRAPALVMLVASLINLLFDPLLIFGLGPFPRMEMRGAALATILSWCGTLLVSFWLLTRKHRFISLSWPRLREMLASWRPILVIALPAGGTNLMVPATAAIITGFVAELGRDALAGFAIGGRIESLSMIGCMALASVMTPFVGQNRGAGQYERALHGVRFAALIAMLWGAGICLILLLISRPIAVEFTDHEPVRAQIQLFLSILPMSFGFYGLSLLANSTFHALNKPLVSTVLIILRLFVLSIPLSLLGAHLDGMRGLLIGLAISHCLTGVISYLVVRRHLTKRVESESEPSFTPSVELAPLQDYDM